MLAVGRSGTVQREPRALVITTVDVTARWEHRARRRKSDVTEAAQRVCLSKPQASPAPRRTLPRPGEQAKRKTPTS